MKQTSVEWVFQELDNYYQMKSKFKSKKEILKQAKEMEKQQIIDALKEGVNFEINNSHSTQINYKKHFEKYYNETFNIRVPINLRPIQLSVRDNVLVDQSVKIEQLSVGSGTI
jgi:hypothetical protein